MNRDDCRDREQTTVSDTLGVQCLSFEQQHACAPLEGSFIFLNHSTLCTSAVTTYTKPLSAKRPREQEGLSWSTAATPEYVATQGPVPNSLSQPTQAS